MSCEKNSNAAARAAGCNGISRTASKSANLRVLGGSTQTLRPETLNPRVQGLVRALRRVGYTVPLSGDLAGQKGIYVYFNRKEALKVQQNEHKLPKGWVLTYPLVSAGQDAAAGKPINHEAYRKHLVTYLAKQKKQFGPKKYREWMKETGQSTYSRPLKQHRRFLVRVGEGAVTAAEAALVAEALRMRPVTQVDDQKKAVTPDLKPVETGEIASGTTAPAKGFPEIKLNSMGENAKKLTFLL